MNDPGLDEPINRVAQNVEEEHFGSERGDRDGPGKDGDEFLDPSRWWFASTANPLIAACFGPIASAFNICAIANHWRVSISSGIADDLSNETDIDDPTWLLAVNGVSLGLAIIANLALLLNMAKRIPFSIAQPITIGGWFVSSFILIGLLVAANYAPGMMLPDGVNRTFTQAYYYAGWASGIYFIISSLMIVTVWGARTKHYSMDFQLTVSQRTLMLQTTSFVVYLLSGAAIWHRLEGWSFTDAVYWANYTLLTIGLGDLHPTTHAGRSLLFPFAVGGIVILGLVVGSIRSLMLERGKQKFSARMAERMRERAVRQMAKTGGRTKLSLFEKWHSIDPDKPHQEKREQEFVIMRRIQYQADIRRKWMALFTSTIMGFILWFVGAVVFYVTESSQGWTYFEALYFCYVSLLTIGYGDLYPLTNAGKSFYVFWSLLAIPTLTMLISNMGDTVIRLVSDATLWLGELTILPGEGNQKRLRRLLRYGKRSKQSESDGKGAVGAAEDDIESDAEKGGGKEGDPKKEKKHDPDIEKREDAAERDELDDADAARARGDPMNEDKHVYRFLLIREIRHVMDDVGSEPAKQYSYDKWCWFLQLLGESESDEKFHQDPAMPDDVKANAQGRHDVGIQRKVVPWSWLGERSPLLGDMEEANWVLERLTLRLEEELRDESRNREQEQESGGQSS